MDRWYLGRGKVKTGPYSRSQLEAAARTGGLSATDMLLKEGTKRWIAAGEVFGLSPSPAAPPAPRRKRNLDWWIVGVAVVASGCAANVLGFVAEGGVVVFLSGVLGGIFASALARHSPLKHSLWASLADVGLNGLVWLPLIVGATLVKASEQALEGIPVATFLSVYLPALLLIVICTIPGYLIGSLLDRTVMALGRRLRPRERWMYQTRSGKCFEVSGPWRHPVVAGFWRFMGWFLMLTCWVPIFVDPFEGAPGIKIAHDKRFRMMMQGIVAAFVLGKGCLVIARKRTAPAARDVLREDDRAPIVYLRSFQDDGVQLPNESGGWTTFAGTWRILSKTAEQRLAEVFSKFGPVVAIGRPGEELPEMGAARIYVGDEHWQDLIIDLLAHPDAVAVLRAGETEGLRWEMSRIGKTLRADQVILFLPFAERGWRSQRNARYAPFRAWASECLPAELPEKISDDFFMYFTGGERWQGRLAPFREKVPGRHPMANALTILGKSNHFDRRRFLSLRLPKGRFSVTRALTVIAASILVTFLGISWIWLKGGFRDKEAEDAIEFLQTYVDPTLTANMDLDFARMAAQFERDPAKRRQKTLNALRSALDSLRSSLAQPGRANAPAPSERTKSQVKLQTARAVATWLQQLRQRPDLSSVREPAELAKLPEAERQAWQQFWFDVDALLKEAQKVPMK